MATTRRTDDLEQRTGKADICYKSLREHAVDFLKHWQSILAFFITTVTVVVLFAEAAIEFGGGDPRRWLSYTLLVLASLVISLAWNVRQYLRSVPEGLEDASAGACRIATIQRPLWQFRLALSLLAQKLGPLEEQLQDLHEGRRFVISRRPSSFLEYNSWMDAQFVNLFKMLEVAKVVIGDFGCRGLSGHDGKQLTPKDVAEAVNNVARFYEETIAFEVGNHQVHPIDDLTELHRHMLGWSDGIRLGVADLFKFLKEMSELDLKHTPKVVTCNITFPEPVQAAKLNEEMQKLHNRPEVLHGW